MQTLLELDAEDPGSIDPELAAHPAPGHVAPNSGSFAHPSARACVVVWPS